MHISKVERHAVKHQPPGFFNKILGRRESQQNYDGQSYVCLKILLRIEEDLSCGGLESETQKQMEKTREGFSEQKSHQEVGIKINEAFFEKLAKLLCKKSFAFTVLVFAQERLTRLCSSLGTLHSFAKKLGFCSFPLSIFLLGDSSITKIFSTKSVKHQN